ncbi:thioesterase domain-containing protein [Paenibacillus sp. FSL R5-0623]|nr:thioesterase [Paenibacillus sp. FSL R5-0765]MBY0116256.1 thioesterase [Paenibacillus xylanexedens]
MTKMRLYCVPYAGGSASIYNKWKKGLSESIVLNPVELAGRGLKFSKPLYESIQQSVDDVFDYISSDLPDEEPYALFGHSLGSLIIYELYNKMHEEQFRKPIHMFFSGRETPDYKKEQVYYHLPEGQFIDRIKEMGGTPDEFFENQQLMDMFIPILRKDLEMNETYTYEEKPYKLQCDITILNGAEDEGYILDCAERWRGYTEQGSAARIYKGGHFYLFEGSMHRVTSMINQTLTSYME